MTKFNTAVEKEKVINYMGAEALKYSPEMELVALMLTSFGSDSYYRSESDSFKVLRNLIEKCDKKFVAQAAVYARTVFGMRSITHVCASELAQYIGGETWAKEFYQAIVYRADDMSEIMAYYFANNAKKSDTSKKKRNKNKELKTITGAMKKGFGKAFDKFDKYQLAKYRGTGKGISLVDVVNIVHPTPLAKNSEAIELLVKGKLKSFDTWESELSAVGQKAGTEEELITMKKDAWAKLISEKKIGIFALLRNLRNIFKQAPESIPAAMEILTDENKIKKSLILPFRYLSAYTEIEKLQTEGIFEKDVVNVKSILEGIEKAAVTSIQNLPTLLGKTIILPDNSGSMRGDSGGGSLVSKMSNTKTSDIANLFATMYWMKSDNTSVGLFGDKLVHPELDRKKGLFDNFKLMDKAAATVGPGTETGIFTMFKKLIKDKIIADTIVIFSDCQIGDGCAWYGTASGESRGNFMKLFSEYRKINPNFRCYSVDLRSYGTTVFDGSVIKIAGWSDKIFDIMKFAEQDKNALINEIKKIQFTIPTNTN